MRQDSSSSSLQGDQVISPAVIQSTTMSKAYPCQGLDSRAPQLLPSPLSHTSYSSDQALQVVAATKTNESWSEACRLGKRSRSRSSASSSDLSLSDGASSTWPPSSSSSNQELDSPATSVSGQSSDEDSEHPRRGSPSATMRKTMRCRKQDTACTAPLSKQCLETSVSTSTSLSELDVAKLGNDISSFGLSSQEPSPEESTTGSVSTAPSKNSIVDHLMDAAVATVDHIWPLPAGVQCSASHFPLHLFIRETVRRSRTSCSTLQAALLYCVRSGPAVRALRTKLMGGNDTPADFVNVCIRLDQSKQLHPLLCGRRIFLASIMVASKFLQDKNYSNQAWSKITGLPVKELGIVEREFLKAIDWQLYIKPGSWEKWTKTLREPKADGSSVASASAGHSHPVAVGPSKSSQPLPAAVSRLKAEVDRSATPTPSTTPTTSSRPIPPSRSALARSQSDAAPFRPYDVAVTAEGLTAYELSSCRAKSSPWSVGSSSSVATPTLASTGPSWTAGVDSGFDAGEESDLDAEDDSDVIVDLEAASSMMLDPPPSSVTTPAAPYPMHRSFVRSAASFSAVGVDRMEMMVKA